MIQQIKQTFIGICICIVCIGLCNCTHETIDNTFSATVGIDVHHYLDITIITELPINHNDLISLYIVNRTADCIVFPYNFGVRIFVYKNGSWIEIPDVAVDVDHQDIILDPRGGKNVDAGLILNPDYSQLGKIFVQQRMRIVLAGKLCKNGIPSNQSTADYIEINIEP